MTLIRELCQLRQPSDVPVGHAHRQHQQHAQHSTVSFLLLLWQTGSVVSDITCHSIVEQHQKKFGLAEEDLQQRKQFITDVRRRIDEIRTKIDSPAAVAKIERDKRESLFLHNQDLEDARNLRGDLTIAQEREDQALLFKQQDEVLEDIHDGATQLHEVALEMNKELKDQSRMLDEVNQSTSDLGVRLKAANNKVTDLIETTLSTKQKLIAIVCLTVTFLILTMLVFYT